MDHHHNNNSSKKSSKPPPPNRGKTHKPPPPNRITSHKPPPPDRGLELCDSCCNLEVSPAEGGIGSFPHSQSESVLQNLVFLSSGLAITLHSLKV